MENNYRINIFCLLFILFMVSSLTGFSQLDNLHYIPPMCSFTSSAGNVQDHRMVLTTSETTAFDVTIKNNDGTFVMTVKGLSSSSPKKISLNFSKYLSASNKTSGTGLNSQGVIGTSDLNKILNKEGLIVSGSKKFFVSIQQKSTAQGDLLTSKGTTGFGTDFYSGHMYSSTGGYDGENGHFISAMATENNTNITFNNPRIKFSGRSNNSFTVSLNKGQSIVIGVSVNQLKSQGKNLNHVNGTHITSNKPIAVSSGSWCASGYPNNSPGRDIGFDQLVPTDVVGDEYILIKGEGKNGGAQYNEKALVVATEDNTVVTYKNDSKTKTLTNAGDYFFTNINDFSNTTDGNIYIHADKKIFCYQTLSGANAKQTAGFCFIPPLKCTADKEVTIAFANKLSSLTVNPILKLVTQSGSQIKLNGVNLGNASSYRKSVPGNIYWETYNIPKSELQLNKYNHGTNWIFKISSTGALNAMLAVQSGNVGGGGFFSGFGDVPQIEQNPEIETEGLCGGNVELNASGFDSYNWYKDGVLVSGEHHASYEPSEPGRYKVTGLSPCGGSSTESFPSSEIIIYPCLSVSDVSVTEGTSASVRVELSHPWSTDDAIDVTFDYQTTAGSASSGPDYSPKSGSATIPSGSSFVNISVPITNDILDEDDEEFTFTISNVVEAVENVTVGTITILDDNDPMPTITVTDQTYDEDAGTVNLSVNLSTASGKTVTADYSILDNTTTQTSDYTASNYSGSLSFAPGDQEETISFSIIDDAIYEPGADEYFTILLSKLVNTSVGDISADISITDNDSKPKITVNDASIEEGGSIIFQTYLDHAADVDITFDYEIELGNGKGYAKKNDFTSYSSTGTITISAGETSVSFPSIVTKDDNANEDAEVFTIKFSSVSNAILGNTSAIGTILDNEGNTTLSISGASATEGNTINFTISASPVNGSAISFNYTTTDGTATSLDDFTGSTGTSIILPANQSSMTFSISTVQDTEEEGDETFTVEISGQPKKVDIGISTATGTIIDDDDTPVAKDDNYSVNEDAVLSDNVMSNDSGLSDAPVTVSSNTNPTHGSLNMNTNGSFTYTPYANYNGLDSFEYTIQDVDGDISSATAYITVSSINDVPIANNDTYTIPEDTQLNANVVSNDQKLFDLPITISLVSNVSHGALTLNTNGTFSYLPNSEYFGVDNFTYKLSDGNGDAVQAKVIINVTFINDGAPIVVDDDISTNEDTPVSINVLTNDTDVDGYETIDIASVLIKTGPSHGSLSQDHTSGKVTYTPNSNYTGSDSFTYTIKDDADPGLESNVATVSITVTVDNDPPVAICKSGVIIYLDTTGNYNLLASEIDNGSNDDRDGGTVSLSVFPNTFDCSDKGSNSVTLTVTDEDNSSSTCTTTITVLDNSNPTIKTAQLNIPVSAESGVCGALVNYTGPVFTDNCDGDQSGILIAGLSSGSTFPIGDTDITYEYTDASGNGPIQATFTVTVVDDIDPIFSNTANRNLSPNSSGCSYLVTGTSFDLKASDNCGTPTVVHNYDGGGSSLNNKSFPLGTTDVTWTAEDIHGNSISKTVEISVYTDLSASLTGPSSNQSCEGEDVEFTASASGGNSPYSYQFFVNGVEKISEVSGNTLTINTLTDGNKVTTRITDNYGCSVTSSEIEMIIHPKPAPMGIFFED
ncbi:Ig-like domain-containing protein [Ancylomarina sp. 16SWW S1-10-2]|uniref:Ig-like domain-containing protein n=1 Tax=Ancylomarina sp. 16SWW S1-10-2 TaxID=2499681 RepID=UPI0012AEA188|nr:Ig-like domain-containing protein [Ancylomarina sp. 16SWW S1-10-2]MRT92472.1 tandem-95 repeat protein [Ancylomarina sp. 16SWW S1-10-2]